MEMSGWLCYVSHPGDLLDSVTLRFQRTVPMQCLYTCEIHVGKLSGGSKFSKLGLATAISSCLLAIFHSYI